MSHNPSINYSVAEILQTLQPSRVLDVGCGYGEWRPSFPADWVGLDIWLPYLASGLQRHRVKVRGDATMLPFQDCSFDVVLCCEVLEHVRDPAALVREAKRVAVRAVMATLPTRPLSRHAQGAINNNPYEAHITELTWQELWHLGFHDLFVLRTLDPVWNEFLFGVCEK